VIYSRRILSIEIFLEGKYAVTGDEEKERGGD